MPYQGISKDKKHLRIIRSTVRIYLDDCRENPIFFRYCLRLALHRFGMLEKNYWTPWLKLVHKLDVLTWSRMYILSWKWPYGAVRGSELEGKLYRALNALDDYQK